MSGIRLAECEKCPSLLGILVAATGLEPVRPKAGLQILSQTDQYRLLSVEVQDLLIWC
jgi:hypothetical protein